MLSTALLLLALLLGRCEAPWAVWVIIRRCQLL